jgi:Tol biopolymer transport system component
MRTRTCTTALLAIAGALALAAGTASAATFPGTNGLVAFSGFDGSDYEIFVVNPDGSGLTPLTNNPTATDVAPSWSGDGERIAFVRNATGNAEIAVMDHNGQNQVELTSDVNDDVDPTFSPDGQKIAFVRPVGLDQQIWVMDANGQNQVQLTNFSDDSSRPQFSPDGQRIVFERTLGGFDQIFVMDANGQNQTQLTSVPMTDSFQPNWFPDGNRIAFTRSSASDDEIFSMNADGSNQTAITANDLGDHEPAVSPDGQLLISGRLVSGNQDLFIQDLATGVQSPFVNRPQDDFDADWQALNPPACDLTGAPKQKSTKEIVLTVLCTNENAAVSAAGSGKAPKPKTSAVVSKAKRFTIPAVTTQVQPGVPATLTLTIPKKGQKALKKAAKAGKKGKATVTATITDDFGQASTDTFSLKFKAKKK